MTRLSRALHHTVTAISLVACVAAVGLWVRGRRHVDCLQLDTPYHVTCVVSGGSRIHLIRLALDYNAAADPDDAHPLADARLACLPGSRAATIPSRPATLSVPGLAEGTVDRPAYRQLPEAEIFNNCWISD